MVTVLVALISALAGLAGGVLASRSDRDRWRRELTEQAYTTCLRSALHVGREVGLHVQGYAGREGLAHEALSAFYDEGLTAMEVLGSRRAYELAGVYSHLVMTASNLAATGASAEQREVARQDMLRGYRDLSLPLSRDLGIDSVLAGLAADARLMG